jgi:hypothetical protein
MSVGFLGLIGEARFPDEIGQFVQPIYIVARRLDEF